VDHRSIFVLVSSSAIVKLQSKIRELCLIYDVTLERLGQQNDTSYNFVG